VSVDSGGGAGVRSYDIDSLSRVDVTVDRRSVEPKPLRRRREDTAQWPIQTAAEWAQLSCTGKQTLAVQY